MERDDFYRIEIAKNAAVNGRVFCILLAVVNVMLMNPGGVVLCALPVGLASACDMLPDGKLRQFLSVSAIASAAGAFLGALINAWW